MEQSRMTRVPDPILLKAVAEASFGSYERLLTHIDYEVVKARLGGFYQGLEQAGDFVNEQLGADTGTGDERFVPSSDGTRLRVGILALRPKTPK